MPPRSDWDALAREVADGRTLWLVHANADADSVAAALALAKGFGGVVGETAGVSSAGKRVAERAGVAIDPLPHPEHFARVVAVDTSSCAQLGPLGRRLDPASLLLVDHHAYGDLADAARLAVVDPARSSASEVALALLRRAGREPDAAAAFALATGLVADSASFRHATDETLRDFLSLSTAHGFRVADCLAVLDDEEPEGDVSRRLATLKAAERVLVEDHDGLLLATSRVSAFEAAAATAFLRLGADLAVVAAERGGKARVSLRGSRALRARGVNLGEVANAVGREAGWSGGGHEGAAGLNGPSPAGRIVDACLERVKAALAASARSA